MKKISQKKKIQNLISRAAEISMTLEGVKPLYREFDDIIMELVEMEVYHAYSDGLQMTVIDNFATSNTSFRVARIKRFDLKIERTGVPLKELKSRVKKSGWEFPTKKSKG